MPIIFTDSNGNTIPQGITVTITSSQPTIVATTDANGSVAATLLTGVGYVAMFSGLYALPPSMVFYASSILLATESGSIIDTESGLELLAEQQPIYYGYAAPVNTLTVTLSISKIYSPLQTILPAYPYQQYQDDPNIVAFFSAVNTLAQPYLDFFNQTALAVYTNPNISGPLLDWIGQGIYGISRPVFSSLTTRFVAGLNSSSINSGPINGDQVFRSGVAVTANDDYYKRVLTWWMYAGNGGNGGSVGRYFNIEVLRLKVARFLYGVNGTDATLSQAQSVSIQPQTPLNPPPAPILTYTPGGSFPTRKYAVRLTYTTALGETTPSFATNITVPANNLFRVTSPPAQTGVTGYNVYANLIAQQSVRPGALNVYGVDVNAVNANNGASQSSALTKQTGVPFGIGMYWTLPTTGLIVGSPLPTSNTSNPIANFIITVPTGIASTYFQQAMENNVLSFPFLFTATVVIG